VEVLGIQGKKRFKIYEDFKAMELGVSRKVRVLNPIFIIYN
jgi:hypothetical protein